MSAVVTRAEGQLLTLARVAVGVWPASDARRLLFSATLPPQALGPTARRLLAETLARGTVLALAREGGWVPQGGQRLWERFGAPPLHFSGELVRVFQWLLTHPQVDAPLPQLQLDGPLTLAEQAVLALLFARLDEVGAAGPLGLQAAVREAPLVVLAHAGRLGQLAPLASAPAFDVVALAPFVEGLRHLLARCWLRAEVAKGAESSWARLSALGQAQSLVAGVFLDAIDAAGQRPLAGFLVDAGVAWLATGPTAQRYGAALDPTAPLRERVSARRDAGGLLRSLARLEAWHRAHRTVRFIDDDYAVAQRLVGDWERLDFAAAAALLAQLESLAP